MLPERHIKIQDTKFLLVTDIATRDSSAEQAVCLQNINQAYVLQGWHLGDLGWNRVLCSWENHNKQIYQVFVTW